MAIVLDNFLHIYIQITPSFRDQNGLIIQEKQQCLVYSFRIFAGFSVIAQMAQPFFQMQEQGSVGNKTNYIFHVNEQEHNPWFFLRQSLETVSIIIFSVYLITVVWLVQKRL